jgi:Putative Actinobacterial Holin-X, holin superfamily III
MTAPLPESATVPRATSPDVSGASVGELLGHVAQDLSTLVRQELDLAKAEVKQEITGASKAAGLLGGAGFAGYMVLLFGSIAVWWGLANVMDQGWAALIVTGLWAVVGAVAFTLGRDRMKRVNPTPERTVETVREIPDALKRPARS